MTLKETIETNYKISLKSKNKMEISTYRLILSSIKDLDILNRSGANKKETDDEDIKKLLKKMIKQRTESIDIYKKNDRMDLYTKIIDICECNIYSRNYRIREYDESYRDVINITQK